MRKPRSIQARTGNIRPVTSEETEDSKCGNRRGRCLCHPGSNKRGYKRTVTGQGCKLSGDLSLQISPAEEGWKRNDLSVHDVSPSERLQSTSTASSRSASDRTVTSNQNPHLFDGTSQHIPHKYDHFSDSSCG